MERGSQTNQLLPVHANTFRKILEKDTELCRRPAELTQTRWTRKQVELVTQHETGRGASPASAPHASPPQNVRQIHPSPHRRHSFSSPLNPPWIRGEAPWICVTEHRFILIPSRGEETLSIIVRRLLPVPPPVGLVTPAIHHVFEKRGG